MTDQFGVYSPHVGAIIPLNEDMTDDFTGRAHLAAEYLWDRDAFRWVAL